MITGAFFPVLCGSAFKNKGVQPLLDAVVDYLPSPLDVPPIKGIDGKGNEIERKPDDSEPLALLAFKIMDDPFVGTITFCRIYSGTLTSGTGVINSTKDRKERIGRMLLMHANNREDIKEAFAGDIVALAGLKEVRTGDTLCDAQQAGDPGKDGIPRSGHRDRDRAEVEGRPGEARRRARQARRRGPVVPRLHRPGIRPDHHQGHGRAASRHQGRHPQAHLQGRRQYRRAAGRLSREDHPVATVDYTHKKQTGGTGQFARVKIVAEPNAARQGLSSSRTRSSAARCRRNTSRASRRALNRCWAPGVLAGFPVVDLKVTLIDGRYHDVDSSALAFEIAARAALREALRKAASVLLEPIMKVEVVTPEDYTGSVIGDLNSRRGQIQGQDMRGNANVINAMVPLANMFGYVNKLRSMSQGRATFTMQFDHYAEVPKAVASKVQAKYA